MDEASGVLGIVILAAVCVVGLLIYFLPAFIAGMRGHQNTAAIFILNLLLGWSFLGWVAALVWSFTEVRRGYSEGGGGGGGAGCIIGLVLVVVLGVGVAFGVLFLWFLAADSGAGFGGGGGPGLGGGFGSSEANKRAAARGTINLIDTALALHYFETMTWPTSLDELARPLEGPPKLNPQDLTDPWGRRYHYDPAGPHHDGNKPDVWSEGGVGRPRDEWITNW